MAALLSLSVASAPASANPPEPEPTIQNRITRLAHIDWALTFAVSGACDSGASGFGLTLDSLDAYPEDERQELSETLGWDAHPHVLYASPTAKVLLPGDAIIAINGQPIFKSIREIDGVSTAHRAEKLLSSQAIDRATSIRIMRDDARFDYRLTPQSICAHNAVVVPDDSRKAYSDRAGLAVTAGLMDYVRNDDELALLVAHELAHILLYDHFKRTKLGSKRKEDAVDALGARIAGCAGFDVSRGIEFWNDFDKTRPLSFIPSLTHRKSKTRYRDLQRLVGNLDCDSLVSDIRAARAE